MGPVPAPRVPQPVFTSTRNAWATAVPDPRAQRTLTVEGIVRTAEKASATRPAAVAIVRIADDPDTGAQQLAQAVSAEPSISAHLMRVANSAYFGLSGRVKTLQMAVTVLGFSTVRALAGAALLNAIEGASPPGVWRGAVAQAAAASRICGWYGVNPQEGFCAGLLCGLGRFLLFQADPDGYVEHVSAVAAHPADTAAAERDWCGTDHAEVAARVFAAWKFPTSMVDAVADQHRPLTVHTAPLTTVVHVSGELAARVNGHQAREDLADVTQHRVTDDSASGLLADIATQSDALFTALGVTDSTPRQDDTIPVNAGS